MPKKSQHPIGKMAMDRYGWSVRDLCREMGYNQHVYFYEVMWGHKTGKPLREKLYKLFGKEATEQAIAEGRRQKEQREQDS